MYFLIIYNFGINQILYFIYFDRVNLINIHHHLSMKHLKRFCKKINFENGHGAETAPVQLL